MFSKKRRLINQWIEKEQQEGLKEEPVENTIINKSLEDFVSTRLNSFNTKIEGDVAKGTFLVIKEDVFKPDCAIWKLDNQNLLQKYPPINLDSIPIIYKNSSTVIFIKVFLKKII